MPVYMTVVKRKRRRVMGLELWCPWSGVTIGKEKIQAHQIAVVVCDNGSLMGYCPHHIVRCFTGDQTTIKRVHENFEVSPV